MFVDLNNKSNSNLAFKCAINVYDVSLSQNNASKIYNTKITSSIYHYNIKREISNTRI